MHTDRVTLVQWKRDKSRVFALKACSKEFIRMSQQEQHVNNEKMVMITLSSVTEDE